MKIRNAVLAAACALAACSPPAQNGAGNSSTARGAPAPGGSVGAALQPGQYRTTVTIMAMTMPGMPASAVQQMRARPTVTEDCVTSDDVAEMMRKSLVDEDHGRNCTENSMNSAGGRILGSATCRNEDGSTYTMQMNGTYGSNRVEMDMNMSGQSPMGPMTQQMHMLTERIGECPTGGTN